MWCRLVTLPWVLVCVVAQVASAAAPVPPELADRADREGRARVIVRLAAPAAHADETAAERQQRRAAIARVADAALARIGGPARDELRRYRALPLLALALSPRELVEIAEADGVLAIEADRALEPSLGQSIPRVGADVTASVGFDGSGSALVIVDTGVESGHAFFGGRVVAEACFSLGRDCPNGRRDQFGAGAAAPCDYGSLCWHGTHVAGIAAGQSATLRGVAPGAQLIAIQVGSESTSSTSCGSAGTPCVLIYDSDALAALDYVADTLSLAWNVAAVNLSFGSTATWSSEASCDAANSAYKVAIDALAALGIASVAASGNGSDTTGSSAPACISSAIGVAASTDTGEASWVGSNAGPPLDLFAPGTNITSSLPGGVYGARTGTSMASPHVAGAVAVLEQADPGSSVATRKLALENTGFPLLDTRTGLVHPRVQVDDAVRSRAPAQCFDGLDNDSDGAVDVDGDGGSADVDCSGALDDSESPPPPTRCGIGPELLLPLALLAALHRKLRRTCRSVNPSRA